MIANGSPERAKRPKHCSPRNQQSARQPFDRPGPPTIRRANRGVLGIIPPPAPVRHDQPQRPVAAPPVEVPRSQFARIRTLVKYGMTAAQVAEVYRVPVGDIERLLGKGLTAICQPCLSLVTGRLIVFRCKPSPWDRAPDSRRLPLLLSGDARRSLIEHCERVVSFRSLLVLFFYQSPGALAFASC